MDPIHLSFRIVKKLGDTRKYFGVDFRSQYTIQQQIYMHVVVEFAIYNSSRYSCSMTSNIGF
jgi:hypothetical protein